VVAVMGSKKHHWTPKEEQILRDNSNLGFRQLAYILNLEFEIVRKKIAYMKNPRPVRRIVKKVVIKKSKVMPERIKDKLGYYDNFDYQAISL
jgi:hypothetical protein